MKKILNLFVLTFILSLVKNSVSVSLEEYLTLTESQNKAMGQFRERVSSRLPHSYMKDNLYLIRWLRATNFNLDAAEKLLMENIKWRKENRIDDILKEDWDEFERDYRYTVEGCDKEGRPVVSVLVGDWDMRKAVVEGKGERMKRYFDYLMEEINTVVRKEQAAGKNVTQYSFIFEMEHFNLLTQGCPGCIPIFIHLFTSYESHFPWGVHKMTLVNAPAIFQPVLQILKPLMGSDTINSLFIYGKNKTEWQTALLKESAPDQLTKQFGGTREKGFDIESFRELGKLPC